jgi:hypothetical protein
MTTQSLTAVDAALLLGTTIPRLTELSAMCQIPGGFWREGDEYRIDSHALNRLREIRAGRSPLDVMAAEVAADARRTNAAAQAEREVIARAEAVVAAEKRAQAEVNAKRAKEIEDRRQRNMAAHADALAAAGTRFA